MLSGAGGIMQQQSDADIQVGDIQGRCECRNRGGIRNTVQCSHFKRNAAMPCLRVCTVMPDACGPFRSDVLPGSDAVGGLGVDSEDTVRAWPGPLCHRMPL
jgi:hypothetical protein